MPRFLRRGLASGILIFGLASSVSVAAAGFQSDRWTKIPSVTILCSPGDSRLAAVQDAVEFWNRTFAELGTSFRLGTVSIVAGTVPDDEVQLLGDQVLNHSRWQTIPRSLQRVPGDLLIILSHAQFISYTATGGGRVIIAIKDGGTPPLNLPNVLPNVIAHELGHAVGLDHNQDAAFLMCGRPASCRPDAFESAQPRFFPLSDADRTHLRALYPMNWTAQSGK
jgi:hypothetical protein